MLVKFTQLESRGGLASVLAIRRSSRFKQVEHLGYTPNESGSRGINPEPQQINDSPRA
jgi:hypothetical protein